MAVENVWHLRSFGSDSGGKDVRERVGESGCVPYGSRVGALTWVTGIKIYCSKVLLAVSWPSREGERGLGWVSVR